MIFSIKIIANMCALKRLLSITFTLFLSLSFACSSALAIENSFANSAIPDAFPEQLKTYIYQLKSSLPDDRIAAIKGVSEYWATVPESIKYVIERVDDSEPSGAGITPGKIAEELLKQVEKKHLVHLLRGARHRRVEVRKSMVAIIGSLNNPESVDPLISLLKTEKNVGVRELLSKTVEDLTMSIILGLNITNSMSVRKGALRSLGKIKNSFTTEIYLSALKIETDPGLRLNITAMLKNRKDPLVKRPFKEIIVDKEESLAVRRNVATALRNFKGEDLIEQYVALLGEKDSLLNFLGKDALQRVGLPKTVEGLTEVVHRSSDVGLRLNILRGLSHTGHPGVTRLFSDIVMDTGKEGKLRHFCFSYLSASGKTELLTPLLLINDPDPGVREVAAIAIEQANLPEVHEILLKSLKKEKRPEVRKNIFAGLGKYVNAKILALNLSPDPVERMDAAGALGGIGSPEAIESLVLSADSEKETDVRLAIVEALNNTKDRRIVLPLIQILKKDDEDPKVRVSATLGLARFSGGKVLETLVSLLQEKQPQVRRAAVVSLRGNSNEKVPGILLKLFNSESDNDVKVEITENLRRSDNPRVTSLFIKLAKDKSNDVRVRRIAISSLAKRWETGYRGLFISALTADDVIVRKSVISALIADGSTEAGDPLIRALHRENDPENRRMILKGLSNIVDLVTLKSFSEIIWGRNSIYPERILKSIKSLYSPDLTKRAIAADFLAEKAAENPEFISFLTGILNDESEVILPIKGRGERTTPARIVLKHLSALKVAPDSLTAMVLKTGNDPLLRIQAVVRLGETGKASSEKILIEALGYEKNTDVREAIVKTLRGRRGQPVREAFIEILRRGDDAETVRIMASESLASDTNPGLVGPLVEIFLNEGVPTVKTNIAIRLLGANPNPSKLSGTQKKDFINPVELGKDYFIKGDKRNLPHLLDALMTHPSNDTRKNALSVLEKVDPDDVPEKVLSNAFEREKDRVVKKGVLRLLAMRKSKFMVVPFAGILVDESEEVELRRLAAQALGGMKVPFVYENFNKVLNDSDVTIRNLAVQVLLESGSFEGELIGRLQKESDVEIRSMLAQGLAGRKNKNFVLPFKKLAENRNEDIKIRRVAAGALIELDIKVAAQVSRSLLEEKDPVLQGLAIKALIESSKADSVDSLLDAMNRKENSFMKSEIAESVNNLLASLISGLELRNAPRIRRESAAQLGKIKYYVATDALLDALLLEKDSEVKLRIVQGLEGRKTSKIAPHFKELLLDTKTDDQVREIAARWILHNAVDKPFPLFVGLLEERNDNLRETGVAGLKKIKDDRGIPILVDLFKREKVLKVKLKALETLTVPGVIHGDVPPLLASLFGDLSENLQLRRIAGKNLIANQDVTVIRAFIFSLNDGDPEIRKIAQKGLEEASGSEKVLTIVAALKEAKDRSLKKALVRELTGVDEDRKIMPLLKIIHSVKEPIALRYEAAEALSGPTGDEVAKAYMSFLDDKNPIFRKIAAKGLKKVGSPLAAVSLMTAFQVERDREVKLAMSDSAETIPGLLANSPLADIVTDRNRANADRKAALSKLISLKMAGLTQMLHSLLKAKDDVGLQKIAAKELGRTAGGQKRLVGIVRGGENLPNRRLAAEALSASGYGFVRDLLGSLLTDSNEVSEMRKYVFSLYKNREDSKNAEVYGTLLKDPDPEFRFWAIEELEALSPPDKESLFADLLKREKNIKNREKVLSILKGNIEISENNPETDSVQKLSSDFPPEVATEINRLQSEESPERGAAAQKLGEFGKEYPEVIPYLVQLLGNDDAIYKIKKKKEFETTTPALEAVKALGNIGEVAFAPLLAQARDKDRLVRLYTVMAIGAIGEKLIVKDLIELIADEQAPYVRREITRALIKHQDGNIVELFLTLVRDKSEFLFVRIDAAEYLSKRSSDTISDAMEGLFKEGNKKLRLIASEYYTKNSTVGHVDALISAFVRESVVSAQAFLSEALKLSQDPKTVPIFIEQMKRDRVGESAEGYVVRKNMLEGLVFFNKPEAFSTYREALEDEDPELRELAVKGLSALEDSDGLPVLLDKFDLETDDFVKREIVLAISSFDEPVVLRKLVKIVKNYKDMDFRLVAIKSLGRSKDPDATKALIAALSDPEFDIQDAAIEALIDKGDTASVDSLKEYSEIESNDSELREKVKEGVLSIVGPLLKDLSAPETTKRVAAAKRLSVIKSNLIAEPFISALKTEKKAAARLLLLEGLKEQKNVKKVEPLLAIFKNSKEKINIRRAAVDALMGGITWEVVNILKEGLLEKDSKLRGKVAERISENEDNGVISILIEAFKREKKKKNRMEIVKRLKAKTSRGLIPFFSDLVSNQKEKYKIRVHAAEGLKNQKDPSSFEIFSDLLLEKKASLRSRGVEGLGILVDPLSIEMLIKLLSTEKVGSVRFKIVEALSVFDSPDVIPVFVKILSDKEENFKVRKLSASYLKEQRVGEALDVFTKILNGKDSALQKIASEYLLVLEDSRLVPAFVALLSDRDSVLRKRAVEGLMNNKDIKALGPIIKAEKAETDPNVKKMMTEGIERLIAYSEDLLMRGELQTRKIVSLELSKLDDSRLLEISVKALEAEKVPLVRERLTACLKKLDDPSLVPLFITIMGDSEESATARTNAAEGLKKAFLPEILGAFSQLLSDPDPSLRALAVGAVSEYEGSKSLKLLLKAMKMEKAPEVRVVISEGLRELKDPDLLDALIKVMLDLYEEPRVRQNAASGLKYMKDKKNVAPFVNVIADDDAFIRLAAVEGLAESGDLRRVKPFISRLSVETDSKIKLALTEGLKGVDDSSAAPPLKEIIRNGSELLKIRQNAAMILSGLTGGDSTDVFQETVLDSDPLLRGVSAAALVKNGDPALLRSMLSLLVKEGDEKVRLRIIGALKGQEFSEIIPPMVGFLSNEEESLPIRRSAAEVLSGIKNTLVVKPLREAMKLSDTPIRVSVLKGLRLNRSSKAKNVFFLGLKDGDPSVRYQATWGLRDLNYLKSLKKAAVVVKEMNIPDNLKLAITMGVYSNISLGRGMGIKAIKDIGKEYPSTIFFLIKLLGDRSFLLEGKNRERKVFIGEMAADALIDRGEEAFSHLLSVLNGEQNEPARVNASRAVLGLGWKLGKDSFFKLLTKENNSRVRANLFRLLEKEGFEGGDDFLLAALADKNEAPETRWVAGKGLLKAGNRDALPIMRLAMSDESEIIREIAALTLGRLGDDVDIPYLRLGLRDQIQVVRYQAVSGLINLRGFKNMVGDINELKLPVGLKNSLKRLYFDSPKIRGLAINYIGRRGVGYPSVNPFLTGLLDDEAEYETEVEGFRKVSTPGAEAERALVRIGEPAVDSLVTLLKKSESDVIRGHAVSALVAIDAPKTLSDLIDAFKKEKNSSIRVVLSKRLMSEKGNKELDDIFLDIVNDKAEHWMVRHNAVKALKGGKGADIIDAFLFALKDEDSVIRGAAAEGLVEVKSRKVLRPLINALDDEYAVVRYNAAQALKNVRSRKLRKVHKDIIGALDDFDPVVRAKAAETLGALKVKSAVPRLVSALGDPDAGVRVEAVKALGKLKVSEDKEAVALLNAALTDQDAEVRMEAISSLLLTKNSKVISTVYESFKGDDWSVRENAVAILKTQDDPKAIEYMVEAVTSKDKNVRLRLVEAFAHLGPEQIPVLVSLTKDDSVRVRRKVAWAFGMMRTEKVKEPLKLLMKDRDPKVRRIVVDSLRKNAGLEQLMTLLREDDDFLVRKGALEGLIDMNFGRKLLDMLYPLLTDKDVRIRKIAALGLGKRGTQFSVEYLIQALRGRWSGIRVEAATALGNLKDPIATDALLNALESGSVELRKSASVALEKITDYEGKPTLEHWKEVKRKKMVANVRESGRLFAIPLAGLLVILLFL